MTRETLYDLAFQYKKTKLWSHLLDTQIFAAKTENNETLFICIMGLIGEHVSVAVYPEDDFPSYYKILDADRGLGSHLTQDAYEAYIASSCIQCSFENKDMLHPSELQEVRAFAKSRSIRLVGKNAYPQFTRFTPYHMPWHVLSEQDLERIAAGLEASMALSDELKRNPAFAGQLRRIDDQGVKEVPLFVRTAQGYQPDGTCPLPGRRKESFPEGSYDNEVLLTKIRSKRRGGIIDCRVAWMHKPVQEHPEDVPYYPAALIAVEESDGRTLSASITKNYEAGHEELLSQFMTDLSARKKRPAKIQVPDERTYALLAEAMKKASIDLVRNTDLPCLDEALYDLHDHIDKTAGDPDDSSLSGSEAFPQEEEFTRMLAELEAMDDEFLRLLPKELTDSLSLISAAPFAPSAIKKRIDRLLDRIDTAGSGPKSSGRNSSKEIKSGKGGRKGGRSKKAAEEPLSYVISISPYRGCYRHVRVCADITLDDLHNMIQEIFGFANDHLYAFFMDNRAWSDWDVYFSPDDDEGPSASDCRLRDAGLYKGKKFLYLFDFGDEWRFECRILRTVEENTDGYQILRSKGDAPDQYPDAWDEDDFYDDEEDGPFW